MARTGRPASTKTDRRLEADALEEAILLPANNPTSSFAAKILFQNNYISVWFPEKNEIFRKIMRNFNFTWSYEKSLWLRLSSERIVTDRIAEITHHLVAAEFKVQVLNSEAREKAVLGTFIPEKRRWIKRGKGGRYHGWFQITWPRHEDFYDSARSIRGSKYACRAVYIPPDMFKEIYDFATHNNFSISEAAQGIIDHYRVMYESGIVLNIKHDDHATQFPAMQEYDFEVDDELLDD